MAPAPLMVRWRDWVKEPKPPSPSLNVGELPSTGERPRATTQRGEEGWVYSRKLKHADDRHVQGVNSGTRGCLSQVCFQKDSTASSHQPYAPQAGDWTLL